jgi:coenzyme F420-reducing hydrogenase alpha subunit
MTHKSIQVGYITRVEGEGSVSITVENGELKDVRLKIFEPPRFFESLLCGRSVWEAPDITARVCGICPVAYQMSAVYGIENLASMELDKEIHDWRRLFYCGEWIQSHSLHLFMLHLPDFLGYSSLLSMVQDHKTLVQNGLLVKKVGSDIIQLLGGRDIHPINVCLGGFYRLPPLESIKSQVSGIWQAYDIMLAVIQFLAGLEYPDVERDYEFLALRGDREYPMCGGRVVSSLGLDIDVHEFEDHIEEFQVRGSNALYSRRKFGGPYLCGPMARLALNFESLPTDLKDLAMRCGIEGGTRNPYRSILVRAIEILYALQESARLIDELAYPDSATKEIKIPAGTARWATEAPRGLLYHRYEVDQRGIIKAASLIPPTSQNQLSMEADLRVLIGPYLQGESHQLEHLCERLIRNHDPCISCAAHFLRIDRHEK